MIYQAAPSQGKKADASVSVPTLHVVIPVFNEAATLATILDRVQAVSLPAPWQLNITLVDDGSSPKFAEMLQETVAHRTLHLIRHEQNQGKGAALRTGFDAVLLRGQEGDAVVVQDADLEYDPNDLTTLLEPIRQGNADAVVGTRWGDHYRIQGFCPRLHRMINGLLTILSNRLTGLRLTDMECCQKMLTMTTLRIVRPHLTEDRFGVEPQLIAALAAYRVDLREIPVSYRPRSTSEGKKIGWKDGVRALLVIARGVRKSA